MLKISVEVPEKTFLLRVYLLPVILQLKYLAAVAVDSTVKMYWTLKLYGSVKLLCTQL